MNEEQTYPRCTVTFTKSSTKDGGTGYTVQVQDGISEEQAQRVFDTALSLRRRAEEAVAGKPVDQLLEESIAANGQAAARE